MSGIIELYKIDKTKIIENLYPIVSNINLSQRETSLKNIYKDSNEYIIGSFEKWVELKNSETEYFKVSYDDVIKKIKTDFFKIDHHEFNIVMDWLFWYFEEEMEISNSEDFLVNLGLIEIGDLHTRYESVIFYTFGECGLNDFDENLKNTFSFSNSIHNPSKSNHFEQAIDFLVVLLNKMIFKGRDLNIDGDYQKIIQKLIKNKNLESKCITFLNSDLIKEDGYEYKLFKDLSEHSDGYLHKMISFKKEIENYNGLIYCRDCY